MHESQNDLARLQSLLDTSYTRAGTHLRSIHTPERRLTAERLAELLTGVCVLDLATVNAAGQPRVAPIDGLFLRGTFWFGSSRSSVRFRHIRRNPAVSAAHTRGERISVIVHGQAHEIDSVSGDYQHLHDYCVEVYGDGYDDWGYWGVEPFAFIEPERLYAIEMIGHD